WPAHGTVRTVDEHTTGAFLKRGNSAPESDRVSVIDEENWNRKEAQLVWASVPNEPINDVTTHVPECATSATRFPCKKKIVQQ
uniref:Uncharacterized protein n=1 Tax=Anopheles minimus TaxID=112268 RepID=A0A182WQA2_9DIPT